MDISCVCVKGILSRPQELQVSGFKFQVAGSKEISLSDAVFLT